MNDHQTPEELHKVREEFERRQTDPYVPRPRWQIVMAWVLILIVVLESSTSAIGRLPSDADSGN